MKLYLYYLNIHTESFHDFKRIFDIMNYDELPFTNNDNLYQYCNYGLIALYGYTNKKTIAKSFDNERNKKYFVKETKEITKEEYVEFKDKHPNMEIIFHKLKDNSGKKVCVLAPNTEISYVEDGYKDDILNIMANLPDLEIFNDEFLEILTELNVLNFQNSFPEFPEGIDIRELDFYINTFGLLYN